MHYLKLDLFVHIGHIVANVTFFLTLAIASLGVELGGTASRERNRETTASGGEEVENAFFPFSSSVFLIRSGSYLAPLPDLNALISQPSNKSSTVPQGRFSCSSFKYCALGLWGT